MLPTLSPAIAIAIAVGMSTSAFVPKIMGFADLSIAEIAQDYNLPVEEVLLLCDQLGIAYKNQQTRLALEDAKAILSMILSQKPELGTDSREV